MEARRFAVVFAVQGSEAQSLLLLGPPRIRGNYYIT